MYPLPNWLLLLLLPLLLHVWIIFRDRGVLISGVCKIKINVHSSSLFILFIRLCIWVSENVCVSVQVDSVSHSPVHRTRNIYIYISFSLPSLPIHCVIAILLNRWWCLCCRFSFIVVIIFVAVVMACCCCYCSRILDRILIWIYRDIFYSILLFGGREQNT